MADFLLTVGGEPEAHERGRRAESRWAGLAAWAPDLVTGRLAAGPWVIRWSAGPRAPVSSWSDGDVGALVLGDPVDGPGGPLDAAAVARRILANDDPTAWAMDGYFLAVVCRGSDAFVLGDVLGLFPVYRGQAPAAFVSSIPLPNDGAVLDPLGLAGLLDFHGAVGGRTILPGVRRVSPGHAVVVQDTGVSERSIFEWPSEESLASKPLDDQDELLHDAFLKALDAQLPESGPVGLLLTGGRDSRTLAGRLAHLGRDVVARTVGEPDDHDVALARRVAERLDMTHGVRPVPDDAFTRGMDIHLACDHLGTGASQCWWRGAGPALEGLPRRSVTGHVYDVIIGGMLRLTGTMDFGMNMPWDYARRFERRWGVPGHVLRALRSPEARDGVTWAEETMRRSYESHPPPQRLWIWVLEHFVRFQVGMVLHPISFQTWPLVPVLDRALIDVAARLDGGRFANRLGQDRMLLRYYPEMSALPHTIENAAPGTALAPSPLRSMWDRIARKPTKPGPVAWRGDRRFVWRNTDFFNPGWSALRDRAEPSRARLHQLIEPEVLDAYLPPPGGPLGRVDFASHQGPKLLVALALLLERYD